MKTSTNRALSLLTAVLLLTALALPSVALALAPNEIEVTISASETAIAQKAEATGSGTYTGADGATIIPDAADNGYTYNNTYQQSTDVSLQGSQEDLVIEKGYTGPVAAVAEMPTTGGTTDTIPNKVVTGADRTGYQDGDPALDDLHDNDTYLDEYTAEGTSVTTDATAFPSADAVDPYLVADILASNGIEQDGEKEYLVEIGDTTITGDKTVQEVLVKDAEGNVLEGYEVTLEASANRTDKVFDSEGGINISGKTNVVLAIDITGSMADDLEGDSLSGGDMNVNSRWAILKQAATTFVDTVYGVERDGSGNITNAGSLNENIGLSLVIYSGGDNDRVARTVTVGNTGNTSDYVFTNNNITELLGYFAPTTTRASLAGTGSENMLANAGTNAQAGYMQVGKTVDVLLSTPSYGIQDASNIHVVFMTDGEANSLYADAADLTSSTAYSGTNAAKMAAGKAGVDAAVDVLERGVSLHNVAINDSDATVGKYMDPTRTGEYFNTQLAAAGFVNDPSATYSLFNVNYTWANTPEQIIETYQNIAQQIINDALVARDARVIDVVPAGFDIYFESGNTQIKVVGKDAKGNTVIEWFIGDLKNGVANAKSTRYFLLPNSTLGDEFTFGTAYTNDSAILFAKSTARPGQEVAIVLDRPAIVLNPFAGDDKVVENFSNSGFGFNIINTGSSGASAGSVYNLLKDSGAADKLQAVDTTVSDTSVVDVFNASIAGVPVSVTSLEGGGWQFENAQLRVHIGKDGIVTYTRLGNWPAVWGTSIDVLFDYDIGFGVNGNGMRQLIGEPDDATATATITLNAPRTPPPDDDDDDDDDIPLNPGNPDDGDFAGIPLGVPQTGGAATLAAGLLLTTTAALAGALMLRRRKD